MSAPDTPLSSRQSSSLLLTEAALELAVGHLRARFKERTQEDTSHVLRDWSSHVDRLLTEAYMAGVRDGFVQGAEAQARTQGADRAAA